MVGGMLANFCGVMRSCTLYFGAVCDNFLV